MATAVAEPVAHRPRTRVPLPPKLRAPGWYRAALFSVLGLGAAIGIDVLIRWGQHQHPLVSGNAIVTVAMIVVPLFFIVGIGCCDYWAYWAIGRPTRSPITRGVPVPSGRTCEPSGATGVAGLNAEKQNQRR